MRRRSKDLNDARAILQRMCRAGIVEHENVETLMKLWKKVEHGLAIGDVREAKKAVDAVTRACLKKFRD